MFTLFAMSEEKIKKTHPNTSFFLVGHIFSSSEESWTKEYSECRLIQGSKSRSRGPEITNQRQVGCLYNLLNLNNLLNYVLRISNECLELPGYESME